MDSPYPHLHRWALPDPDLRDRLHSANGDAERQLIFAEAFPVEAVESPYSFYALMFQVSKNEYSGVRSWFLDYIVENKGAWDPDELVCFLLEVAEDQIDFMNNTHWLKAINMPEMLDLENASRLLWEMYWAGYEDLIEELVEYYRWENVFAKARAEQDLLNGDGN